MVNKYSVTRTTRGTVACFRPLRKRQYAATLRVVLLGIFMLTLMRVNAQEHWAPFPINEGEGGQVINDIAVSKSDPTFVMFGTDVGGAFRSTDGGANWIATTIGLNATSCATIQIDPSNPNHVLLVGTASSNVTGAFNGLYKSTDRGITWTQVLQDVNNSQLGIYNRLGNQLVIDPTSYDASAGFCKRMFYSSATGTFYRSIDGGYNWSVLTSLGAGDYHLAINSSGHVFASFKDALFRSTNNGGSFQQIYTAVDWIGSIDIAGNKIALGIHKNKVYVSTNNGDSFAAVNSNGLPISTNFYVDRIRVSPANTNYMMLKAGNDHTLYSHDGGTNWTQSNFSNMAHTVILGAPHKADIPFAWHPTNANIIWDARHDFMSKSSDGGVSFQWSNKGYSGIYLGQGNTFQFNVYNADYLALPSVDWNGAATYDGGKTWADMTPYQWWGWNYGAYAVSPGVWFYGASETHSNWATKLKITRNGGQTFETHDLPIGWSPSYSCYQDPTDPNIWFYYNYRSIDAGYNWAVMEKGVQVFAHDPTTKALYGKTYIDDGWAVMRSTNKGGSWQKVFQAGGGDLRDVAVDHINGIVYALHDSNLEKFIISTGTLSYVGGFPTDQYGNGPNLRSIAVDPVDPNVIYVMNGGHYYQPDNSVIRTIDRGATWESITPSLRLGNTKYAATNGGGAIDALWGRVNPKTRELIVGTNDFGFWKIGAPGSDTNPGANRTPENPANTVNGLNYSYYHGTWNTLPNFGALTAVKTGTTATFDLSLRNQEENFGFSYTGYVSVPTDGSYTFYTASDDGSRLYIGSTLVVDNDGLHATEERSGTIGLQAGKHAITVNFFEKSGGQTLNVSYAGPSISKQNIPASALHRASGTTGFSGYYKLLARHSGKALEVDGGAGHDGANVQQYTDNGSTAQQWLIELVEPGYYKLTNKASGKCLDVWDASTADGANVHQWNYGGGNNQKWKIESTSGGYYKLTAKHSGRVLDVDGGPSATGDGVNVHQWGYGEGTNQQWSLTFLSSAARMASPIVAEVSGDEFQNSLTVFPNPASAIVHVTYTPLQDEQITLQVVDTQGRIVKNLFTGLVSKDKAQHYSVGSETLKEGLYIIKLKTPSRSINRKVVFTK